MSPLPFSIIEKDYDQDIQRGMKIEQDYQPCMKIESVRNRRKGQAYINNANRTVKETDANNCRLQRFFHLHKHNDKYVLMFWNWKQGLVLLIGLNSVRLDKYGSFE